MVSERCHGSVSVAFFHVLSLTYITDVINVAGHRLSTAEIESALILHPGVTEAAVIGATDDVTGQAVFAFVTLKPCVSCPHLMAKRLYIC